MRHLLLGLFVCLLFLMLADVPLVFKVAVLTCQVFGTNQTGSLRHVMAYRTVAGGDSLKAQNNYLCF